MASEITITAKWRTQQVRHLLDQLSPRRRGQALSVAVNDTARQVRTRSARDVAKGMGMTRKNVDKAIVIRPYSQPDTLTATVRGRGVPLPLMQFAAKQTRKGVTAKAWGNRKLYPGTFIATMKSGHQGVFRRTSKARLPIKELYGSGVAQVMAQEAVSENLQAYGAERLSANTMRQLTRYLRIAA